MVLGPRFVEGGETPDFGHAFLNRTHFPACDRFWLSSVQRTRRVADENKEQSINQSIIFIRHNMTGQQGIECTTSCPTKRNRIRDNAMFSAMFRIAHYNHMIHIQFHLHI